MNNRRTLAGVLLLTIALVLAWVQTARSATITVDTTNDVLDAAGACASVTIGSLPGPDGVTSLREAMCAANVNPGPDTIEFNITSCASGCTIQPVIALPILTDDSTTINGYSQAGAAPATGSTAATLLVQIDGSLIANNNGFNITSAGNVIQGLVINRFPLNGVAIGGGDAVSNVIAGNHIGLDSAGTLDLGNGNDGVFIALGAQNNLVGGDEPSERNVISGNNWEGVAIHGAETSGNIVSGNYIGTSANGLEAKANTLAGVRIYGGAHNNAIGGDSPGDRNILSGNADGVFIDGNASTDNVVSGNYIGTDFTGTAALPNSHNGVEINLSYDNLVGGDEQGERNVISGNGNDGVQCSNQPNLGNMISGNYIGVDATGMTALPNEDDGVHLLASEDNQIGGDTPGERNIISGNGDDGIALSGASAPGNVIYGNYIGVNAAGDAALPNQDDGLYLSSSSDNQIGGDTPEERNVISGNSNNGVHIKHPDSDDNVVSGNYIGVDVNGMVAIPNLNNGVFLDAGPDNNTVGGYGVGIRNIISGNGIGVMIGGEDLSEVTTENTVSWNYIGVAADGKTPLGNDGAGVWISGNATGNTIGAINGIAYNDGDGVWVDGSLAVGNHIIQNSIFSNRFSGIDLSNGANNNMPAPIILSASSGPTTITGTALPFSTVHIFTSRYPDGEGQYFVDVVAAGPAGDFTATARYLYFPYLTATATGSIDGTSEFSAVYTAAVPVLHEEAQKSVDRDTASPGELLTYTISFTNTGTATASATLTDTLAAEVTWEDNASATSGNLAWQGASNSLVWSGSINEGGSVMVTFQVRINDELPDGTVISNFAQVNNGADFVDELHAPDVTVVDHKLYLPLIRR